MKTISLLVLLLCLSFHSHSQDTTVRHYTAIGLYMIQIDEAGKEKVRSPIGNHVAIEYNKFFKSFLITFTDDESKVVKWKFKYVRDTGTKMRGFAVWEVTDNSYNDLWYLVDSIDLTGILSIQNERANKNKQNGSWFVVEGAKPQ